MTPDEQLDLWVSGKSVHNDDRDECCPDFSCCNPDNLAPEHERIAFRDGDDAKRDYLLMGFLSRAVGPHTYVAGQYDE